ncbi:class I SAM-dependent methyltransferase [Picosynechococcus sp. PCC 8807]|uniref:class I SAM-dependent methyltransferase n=1 Tax=Picosynechococcus sp. PCC 8807 TaxID=195248 RepID=UPI000810AEF4|nr:methyltransferase domain-containing protein [Picosynechococcus sp. PCC 8807]ANV89537.1 methyltransferase type 11 [Picosynechococcus sp. PCC 8807]
MKGYINLGCGSRFHQQWKNLDFTALSPGVIGHNLTQGIPFENQSFDVVYHSHLLEHFKKQQAKDFLQECYRVLVPQGTIRVVVPDLEKIVRCYLQKLEVTLNYNESTPDYDWILIELFDQMVREQSGGEMGQLLTSENIPNKAFILERIGLEAQRIMDTPKQKTTITPQNWRQLLKKVPRKFKTWGYGKELLIRLLLNKQDYIALKIGRFRQSGEIHQWMYDRYSLQRLLEECGFVDIRQCAAHESRIPNWTNFNLDTEPDGTIYKPDSLYMEATKPA